MEASPFTSVKELKGLPKDQFFSGVFILRQKIARTTKNGSSYLKLELGDKTGTFATNCFNDPVLGVFNDCEEGAVLSIQGLAEHYQDRLAPKIQAAEVIPEADVAAKNLYDHLVETPPEHPDALWADLEAAIDAIAHPALQETTRRVIEEHRERFRNCPAAIAMHHAYRHGLLEHTVHMARAARALLPLYPEVDPDLAIAGVILHDIGKLEEYAGAVGARTSALGLMQGHVVLGYRIARKAALQAKLNNDLCERLEHIILSHQGEKEWGAAAMAATPEAVFVSMIDNLDAKMGMVQRALRNSPDDSDRSDFLPGLQTSLLIKPPQKD